MRIPSSHTGSNITSSSFTHDPRFVQPSKLDGLVYTLHWQMRGDGLGKSEQAPGIPVPEKLSQDLTPKPRYTMCSLGISAAPPARNVIVSRLCRRTAGDLTNSGVSSSLQPFLAPAAELIAPSSLIPNTLVRSSMTALA